MNPNDSLLLFSSQCKGVIGASTQNFHSSLRPWGSSVQCCDFHFACNMPQFTIEQRCMQDRRVRREQVKCIQNQFSEQVFFSYLLKAGNRKYIIYISPGREGICCIDESQQTVMSEYACSLSYDRVFLHELETVKTFAHYKGGLIPSYMICNWHGQKQVEFCHITVALLTLYASL